MAASSQEEKDKWLEDLTATIQTARERGDNKLQYLSLKSCSKSCETWSLYTSEGTTLIECRVKEIKFLELLKLNTSK